MTSSSSSEDVPYKTFVIGGISAHVYGLSQLAAASSRDNTAPVAGLAVMFFLHGRFGSALQPKFVRNCEDLVRDAEQNREQGGASGPGKKLVVVSFDQRNHGSREVDRDRNRGWKDDGTGQGQLDNESHASDMVSIQCERRHQVYAGGMVRAELDALLQTVPLETCLSLSTFSNQSSGLTGSTQ